MRSLPVAIMLAMLALAPVPALAQPVLITAGTKLLSVDSTTGAAALVKDFGSALGDLTVGPDNRIYVAVVGSGRIDRLNSDATGLEMIADGLSLARQSGLRFDSNGSLYFVDGSGAVLRVAGVASIHASPFPEPTEVVPAGGSAGGIAFTHDGGLLVLNPAAATVRRALRNPMAATGFNAPTTFISGLPASAVGMAVASGGENTAADHTTGQVLITAGNTVIRCPKTGGPAAGCSQWGDTLDNLGQHDEAFSNDTTFVATSFNPNGVRVDAATDNNGHLWKITGAGVAQRLSSASLTSLTCTEVKIKGKTMFECQPYIGVGVPATSRSIEKTLMGTTFFEATYLFGSHLFDAASDRAPSCRVRVTAHQVPVAVVRAALGVDAASYKLLPYLGEEGWITVYQTALVGSIPCSHDASATSVIVAALFGEFSNPRVIACADNLTSCEELAVFGVWSKGPVDDDQGAGGRLDRGFGTKFFVVDRNLVAAPSVFCGFDSPLTDEEGKLGGTFVNTQTIAVKFQAKTGNCANGTFDATLMPVISLLRTHDENGNITNEIIRVPSASGSSNEPPTFRISTTSGQGKKAGESTYIFDLSLVPLLPGSYEIGVTDQNSKIPFQTIAIVIR